MSSVLKRKSVKGMYPLGMGTAEFIYFVENIIHNG